MACKDSIEKICGNTLTFRLEIEQKMLKSKWFYFAFQNFAENFDLQLSELI